MDMIKDGYAEESTAEAREGKIWYLPHHDVYHPHKPSKIRVVFECSIQLNNTSINKELMLGPDLANQTVDVLLRFRVDKVTFMPDTN